MLIMDVNDIPEPARSALYLIDAYGKVHPDNPFMTAIGIDKMLSGDPHDIVRWTDDNKGSFVMTAAHNGRPILILDLSQFVAQPDE